MTRTEHLTDSLRASGHPSARPAVPRTRARSGEADGASPLQAGLLGLQRTAGNAAVAALLNRTYPEADPSPRHQPATGPVVQRANSFYSGQPRATEKPTPLAAIAQALLADAGVPVAYLIQHWRSTSSLKIAKTYRDMLTAPSMETFSRPDEASAWLDTPNPNPGTRKDPSWITAVGNLGTIEDQVKGEAPQQYNGGHLMAWEFLNEAANVKGNIAPQAKLQNQALYRRLERALEAQTHQGQGGLEVIVQTPYRSDPYQVTYQDLFDRGVITDDTIRQKVTAAGVLAKSISLAQMAPDTYDAWVLTQSGVTSPATADKRESRAGITTYPLKGYSEEVANKEVASLKPKPLSVLATNVDDTTREQTAFAFAHHVYLNYRTAVPVPEPDQPRETFEATQQRALRVIAENMHLVVPILRALELEFGLSPTQAHQALMVALMDSEPDPDAMEVAQ